MRSWLKIFSRSESKQRLTPTREKMGEMIRMVEAQGIETLLPDLSAKTLVEIAPQLRPLDSLLKEKGTGLVVRIGTTEDYSLRCRWDSLPIRSLSCDGVLLRTPFVKKDLVRLFKEAGRVLKSRGKVFLSDLHPFSFIVQEEYKRNPAVEEGMPPGFERYFRIFESVGLRPTQIKEAFFDSSLKKFWGDEKGIAFEKIQKSPFLIFMVLDKVG